MWFVAWYLVFKLGVRGLGLDIVEDSTSFRLTDWKHEET